MQSTVLSAYGESTVEAELDCVVLLHSSHEHGCVTRKHHRPAAIKRLWLKQINSPRHRRSEVSTYSTTAPGVEGCRANYVCSCQTMHAGKKPSLKILPLPKHIHCIYFCFIIQRLIAALLAHIYCTHTQKTDLPHKDTEICINCSVTSLLVHYY